MNTTEQTAWQAYDQARCEERRTRRILRQAKGAAYTPAYWAHERSTKALDAALQAYELAQAVPEPPAPIVVDTPRQWASIYPSESNSTDPEWDGHTTDAAYIWARLTAS